MHLGHTCRFGKEHKLDMFSIKPTCILFLLLCLSVLCVAVFAETSDFYFAEKVILSGVGSRSWEKGYIPDESKGYWTDYLPIGTGKDVCEITLRLEILL